MSKQLKSIVFILGATAIVALFALAFVGSVRATKNAGRINAVRPIIIRELKLAESDNLRACVYDRDKSLLIFSLNHQDYFSFKNTQVKIIDLINKETKNKYPNLPVDNEFRDFYWVLENCR